jgi:hypothetical protein
LHPTTLRVQEVLQQDGSSNRIEALTTLRGSYPNSRDYLLGFPRREAFIPESDWNWQLSQ